MEEIQEKMSAAASIDIVDEKAEGPPRLLFRVGAKSGGAADEIISKSNETFALFKEAFEDGMQMKFEITKSDDSTVEFSLSPSSDDWMEQEPFEALSDKNFM